jgi:hypothetical protein
MLPHPATPTRQSHEALPMQQRNPYAAPRTNVSRADSDEEYGEIKVFSA